MIWAWVQFVWLAVNVHQIVAVVVVAAVVVADMLAAVMDAAA